MGLKSLYVGLALRGTRALLERFLLPKPGEGPSLEAQQSGHFKVKLIGHTAAGERFALRVSGDQDPGYGSTAKMITEVALCLAYDDTVTQRGGSWTPASLMGAQLLERLSAHAGLSFEFCDESSATHTST